MSPDSPPPLPELWVERIFAEMRATYGAEFDRQWECPPGVDPAGHALRLKAHWARELAGFAARPNAIRHALDHLPERAPNLQTFRRLVASAPEYVTQAQLQRPAPNPERVREVVGRALSAASAAVAGPKGWAERLRAREEAGERLTPLQRREWRAALGVREGAER